MKRLLLSACLVGVVFAGHSQSPQPMQDPVAPQPINVARVASVPGGVSDRAKSQLAGFQRIALRSPAVGALQADGTPVTSIDDLFAPALPQAAKPEENAKASDTRLVDESAMWVVVTRGAWMHSGPSVSSPVVGHQSPGKEMHLLDSSQGWYQVFDPDTGKRGWVYAKYYLEPIDRPGQKRVVAVQLPQARIDAAPVAAAPTKAVRRVLQQPRFLAPPQVQAERAAPRARPSGEGVASLLDRAFRR
jgi:hypothetical protein